MFDLDLEKKIATQNVLTRHADMMSELVGDASYEECLTWAVKDAAAHDYRAGTIDPASLEMLSREAGIVGETVDELVGRIEQRSAQYKIIAGIASGVRRKAVQGIASAANEGELKAVLVSIETEAEAYMQAVKQTTG